MAASPTQRYFCFYFKIVINRKPFVLVTINSCYTDWLQMMNLANISDASSFWTKNAVLNDFLFKIPKIHLIFINRQTNFKILEIKYFISNRPIRNNFLSSIVIPTLPKYHSRICKYRPYSVVWLIICHW